ncbi:hypothetical protein PFISCL1PPCAC_13426, partial [Pristionchus fissidentatus]
QDDRYLAPEVHNKQQQDLSGKKKADAWSFGIVVWEMFSCRAPFESVPTTALATVIGAGDDRTCHPPIPADTEFGMLKVILLNSWFVDAKLRSSFANYTKLAADLQKEVTDASESAEDKLAFWMTECKRWGAVNQ